MCLIRFLIWHGDLYLSGMWIYELAPKRHNNYVFKRNWLRPQFNMLPIFTSWNSQHDWGYLYEHSKNTNEGRHFDDDEQDICMSCKKLRDKWVRARFGIVNHLALLVCFVSSEKWVQIESIHLRRQICRTPPWFLTLNISGHFALRTWPIDKFTIV